MISVACIGGKAPSVSRWQASAIKVGPWLAVAGWSILWALPATHGIAIILVRENGVFEFGTFAVALVGGIYGLALGLGETAMARRHRLVLGGLGLALFLFAMEEAAWGQHLFGFETPEFIRSLNAQGELTIHNLGYLQGTSEVPEFLISLAAVILLAAVRSGNPLRIPQVMWSLLALMVILAVGDLTQDILTRLSGAGDWFRVFRRYFNQVDELTELLIAVSGLLYLCLVVQQIRDHARRVAGADGTAG
ncbi:MAG: hypothetical protein ACREEE_12085 [Dongiaceae bacterium]